MIDELISAALLALAILLGLSGIGFFIVGLAPRKSHAWYLQYGYAAVCLTGAYYLFRLVFGAP
jgi:hypothetical protein